ncbi:hypothetical protein DPX16_4605 [Anabarilius grahami]|uniref:Uncharacterized protein n=1 Tax=Anabarilius grahami TaxID=495550 RepID=A0A3N0YD27_ANAGA|nr:hypothetical protein DPX16_4605 [Anabarilius grahami]
MDESGPDLAKFKELHSVTDLALCPTKATAQAIGRVMASLVMLERHIWLNLTEIKDSDRTALLDSPVSTSGLIGSAVDDFAECYIDAQKSSQAMPNLLQKLHPQVVDTIWCTFGWADVDLFTAQENSLCQAFFSKEKIVAVPHIFARAVGQWALPLHTQSVSAAIVANHAPVSGQLIGKHDIYLDKSTFKFKETR